MNLAQLSIRYPLYPWLVMLASLIGGLYGIENVGRLEDPKFPVKQGLRHYGLPWRIRRKKRNKK